ncbi:MAG: hypothetical protein IT204_23460 [Fimbriimonadaceae bacterium]|nr:hypothetical protein [Fimbriimonadaceae bacterium]
MAGVLNDLSFVAADTPAEVLGRLQTLLAVQAAARQLDPGWQLQATLARHGLMNRELAPDYPLARAINDIQAPVNVRQLLKATFAKMALLRADDLDDAGEEWTVGDESCPALMAAHKLDRLAISLDSSDRWRVASVELTCRTLTPAGGLTELLRPVRHASQPGHIKEHAAWLAPDRTIRSWQHLWEQWSGWFPDLEIGRDVVEHTRKLPANDATLFRTLQRHLAALQKFAATSPSEIAGAAIDVVASPDSEATLRQYPPSRQHPCHDGEVVLFSWHTRLGDGRRMYFALHRGRVVIGYLGPHLPTVRHPG